MKKIVILLLALSTTYSCSDFLEEENLSNVAAEQYYTTAEGFTSLVNANYAQLKNIYGKEPWLFVAGTDLYARGRTAEPPGLSQYTELNASSEGVDHLYKNCYTAIQAANMALYYSDKTATSSNLNKQIGELKYLRANAYFLLVQTYGDVSLVTEYINTPQLSFDRTSSKDVYQFIIKELEESLKLVGNTAYNGHVNAKAVQHLLALVHLTRGYETFGTSDDFTTAAQYADNVIGGQALSLSFEQLWKPGNEINAETIFSVQYSAASTSTDPFNLGHAQSSYFGPYHGGSEVAGKAPYRTYSLCPTQFALDLYTQDDTRWNATFMGEVYDRYFDYFDVSDHSTLTVKHYYEPKWFAKNDTYKANYIAKNPGVEYHNYGTYAAESNPNFDYQTIPVKKFDDPKAPFGKFTNTRDIILSRLADTYLIASEAYLKAGNISTALQRINEVRKRAGVQNVTASNMNIDFILDERAREMLGEYNRWFDLKRTGKLVERASKYNFLIKQSNFNGNNGQLKILRPIPQAAIDLNQNSNFKQNPAY
ncbi:RagB/SusD family nutrient uptake outer membrane protein [Empedobacter falsenii]